MNIPREFEFKRVMDNCERELEIQLLGWSARPLEPITSPWNLGNLVRGYIEDQNVRVDYHCPRPSDGDPEIVLAMKRLGPYYGGLYTKVRNMWALHWKDQ